MGRLLPLYLTFLACSPFAWSVYIQDDPREWLGNFDPTNTRQFKNGSIYLTAAHPTATQSPPCYLLIFPNYFTYFATFVNTFTQANTLAIWDPKAQAVMTAASSSSLLIPYSAQREPNPQNTVLSGLSTAITTTINGEPITTTIDRLGVLNMAYNHWISMDSNLKDFDVLTLPPQYKSAYFTPYESGVRLLSGTAYYPWKSEVMYWLRNGNEKFKTLIEPPVFRYVPDEMYKQYPRVTSCLPVMQYAPLNPYGIDSPLYHEAASTVTGGLFYALPTASPAARITGSVPASASLGPTLVIVSKTQSYTLRSESGPVAWYTGTPAQSSITLMTATARKIVVGSNNKGSINSSFTTSQAALIGTTAIQNGTQGTQSVYQIFVLTAIIDEEAFSSSEIDLPTTDGDLPTQLAVAIKTSWASSINGTATFSAGYYVAGPIPKSISLVPR